MIAEVTKSLPKVAGIKYQDVGDAGIIETLDKSGFIDGLYKRSVRPRLAGRGKMCRLEEIDR
ncbi:MAG: hypothetical protein M3N35_02935 [Candidatus Binatota bacterium]|nr:hypothetical protein [Candidatus Binatota bacterium]